MQLTQKETSLLKDLKSQEKLCIEKYSKHADDAADPQLKNLFTEIASVEQGHFDTLTKIENGQTPSASSGASNVTKSFTQFHSGDCAEKQTDNYLCSDILATEKHASHLYDTCIFEFTDETLRGTLNHIQKEEQNHGKMIYDYMKANNMYA